MPDKKIMLRDQDYPAAEGVEISYSKRAKEFTVTAWYNNIETTEPVCISLEDFCVQLGITKKDLPPWAE
jgi:hypothetical protein